MNTTQLIWFRNDLRITDNPALFLAHETSQPMLAVFFICEKQWLSHDYGNTKIDFMLRSVMALKNALASLNIPLLIQQTDYFKEIPQQLYQLAVQHKVEKVWCNQEYEINEIQRDAACQALLTKNNIGFESLHDQCILPPNSITTNNNSMYKVFSPFFKRWQQHLEYAPIECLPAPDSQRDNQTDSQKAIFNHLNNTQPADILKHDSDKVAASIIKQFPAGEQHAQACLNHFISQHITSYKTNRDTPCLESTSGLSAYLSVGAISARQCYTAAQHVLATSQHQEGILCWISELCWRDFYRHIIVAYPNIVKGHAFQEDINKRIPWKADPEKFQQWCDGNTGVPIVDAAMRCLNATGFMHNRLRMVVAMFLTKNLFIHWQWGERYFMQKLIDADFASNNGGWQWSASIGTDAAPYFRIMNPFSQAKTHDTEAQFIKKWVPELAKLEASVIHDPKKLLKVCAALGYPKPLVDVKTTRAQAIEVFKHSKSLA